MATLTESSVRSGRNSCSGGSISRIVTGSPSIASKISVKSWRWSGSRASSAARWSLSSSATISLSTSSRRSPRNMCSVRHSPMPCAPNRRARAASSGVSALARTRSRRAPSAWAMIRETALTRSSSTFSPSKWRTTNAAETGTSPANTSPVDPSIEIRSPSRTVRPSRTWNCRAFVSTSSASAPQTQVRPIPRATTAAWEVLPPRLVRMPRATTMPRRSSGLVSLRTRMTSSPRSAHSTAVSESKTALPTAAPGEAFMPVARRVRSADSSKRGNISCANCSPVTRVTASSIWMSPSSTMCTAIRNAASGVRLPTRVCSIQSLPRSTVNSMSHMSR